MKRHYSHFGSLFYRHNDQAIYSAVYSTLNHYRDSGFFMFERLAFLNRVQ